MKVLSGRSRRLRPLALLAIFFGVAALKPTHPSALRDFPISIVALAPDPDQTLTSERATRLIEILNGRFRDQDGSPIFHFHLTRFSRVDDTMSCPELRAFGHQTEHPDRKAVIAAFEGCDDPAIADRSSIPMYLFRSTWDDGNSYIYNPVTQPFIFINVARLDDKWSVLEHEVAHTFGLPESPACGSTPETPTNPMGHVMDFCEGTGGNRLLGFAPWQVALMRTTAPLVAHNLGIKQ